MKTIAIAYDESNDTFYELTPDGNKRKIDSSEPIYQEALKAKNLVKSNDDTVKINRECIHAVVLKELNISLGLYYTFIKSKLEILKLQYEKNQDTIIKDKITIIEEIMDTFDKLFKKD